MIIHFQGLNSGGWGSGLRKMEFAKRGVRANHSNMPTYGPVLHNVA